MQCAGRKVESARIKEQEAALPSGYGGEFGEADIVADGEGDFAVGRNVDQCHFVSWGENV